MNTKMKFWAILLLFYTVAILALVSSCNGQFLDSPQQHREHTPNTHLASIETSPTQPASVVMNAPPVIVCILVDFSGSMASNAILPPKYEDLVPLLHATDVNGGTILYGSIQEKPTAPLEPLFLPPPEKPFEVETASNPFTRKKLLRQYKKELPAYQAREEQRRLDNRAKIDAFIPGLRDFLARGPGGGTDIWSSMTRCQLALMQDPLYWTEATGQEPERFILAVSDGWHGADHSAFNPIDRSIKVLVVTGRKGIGNFEKLRPDPRWFENASAAIRHIVTTINRRK